MIITFDSIFGYANANIIVFQLAFFKIVLIKNWGNAAKVLCKNMLAFSYLAIPTRHEVPKVPTG